MLQFIQQKGLKHMINIKPVSELRNYNKVLNEVKKNQPVFLTKNGHGAYAVISLEEYERFQAGLELAEKLKKAQESDTYSIAETRSSFGL